MGRRGTHGKRGSGKSNKEQNNHIPTQPSTAADQQQTTARPKRKKKHTRSVEAAIKRTRKEILRGIAKQGDVLADGHYDLLAASSAAHHLAASPAAAQTAEAVHSDSEGSRSESTPPDWGDDNEQVPSTEADIHNTETTIGDNQESVSADRRKVKSLAPDRSAQ